MALTSRQRKRFVKLLEAATKEECVEMGAVAYATSAAREHPEIPSETAKWASDALAQFLRGGA